MTLVALANASDIPAGRGMLVEREGRAIAVFNAGGGRFYACGALCPHEDGPIAEGWLEGQTVICPWHGFDFDLETGRCRAAPELAVPVYPARVSDGVVEAELP
jgi:nitrite reductase/ring-hydroxylating ferredoxin subunit